MGIAENNLKIVTQAFVELRRVQARKLLNPIYLPFYDELCKKLHHTFWAPYSSLRTLEEQAKLYDQGRTPQSKALGEAIVTRARAGGSAHNWGCATDWAEFRPEYKGQQIWDKANWRFFGETVQKCGLEWGGSWKRFPDKPHAELKISVSWGQIGQIFRDKGKLEAELAIKNAAIIIMPLEG